MIICKTPLRASFLGGGTDLPEWYKDHGSCVVGGSIDKYTYVIVNHRYDNKIAVGYTKSELVDSVDEIKHDLVRECAKVVGMDNGFEVKTMADVPSGGSGLGSSSSMIISLLNAFYTARGLQIQPRELAGIAFYIERNILNRSVGFQDHYLCALGGFLKLKTDTENITSKRLPTPTSTIMVLTFTGITRNANDILSDQANQITGKEHLYQQLMDIASDYEWYMDIDKSIAQSWEIKKQLSEKICIPEIDAMIEKASKIATAWKVLGAGGGGYLLSCVPPGKYLDFLELMRGYTNFPFKFTAYGTRIIFNDEE